MKKIKILIAFCLSLVAISATAQFRYAGIVGPTLTNLKFRQEIVSVSQVPGFQAGIQGELMFPGIGFGIDIGAIYNMAGAKVDLGQKLMWQSQGYGKEHLMLHQLNIPFHLRFKYTRLNGFEDYLAPFVYGGPEFNILLAHSKCKAMQYSAGDLGLTVGLGAEVITRWQVSASYTWGVTYSLKANILTNYSAVTRQWSLRVAYFF